MNDNLQLNALTIGTYIFQNENNQISWRVILKAFGFEHLLETNVRLIRSQNFGDDDYLDNIVKIIYDAMKENYENSLKMVKYILINYTDSSENEIEKIINSDSEIFNIDSSEELFEDISSPGNEEEIFEKAFISYSTENKSIAHTIKEILEDFGINGFLAHEDIEMSQEWQDTLMKELGEVNLVVAILSEDFNKSFFCIQEVGIALYNNITIIPISIDGTKPEGFLKKIQSKKVNLDKDSISINLIKASPEFMVNNVINTLEFRPTFDDSARVLNYLIPFFKNFNVNQVENFVKAAIKNDQIYKARNCKVPLNKFYNINKDKIPLNLLEEFKNIL